MRVGFLSEFDRERIAFAKQNGFGSIELLAREPDAPFLPNHDGWQTRAAELAAAYRDVGIRISAIGGFYVNHMDADPAVAAARASHVRNCIQLAAHIGVPTVAGFAGRVVGQDLEASLPEFKRIWSQHARFAEDHGVRIAFEHCPMGSFYSPLGGINCICTPEMWDRCFDAVPSPALGLEWDPSHLICQFIDPIANIRRYGDRILHVHAKDARIYRDIVARCGIYTAGAMEHCFPGLGDADWGLIVKELLRAGYHGDLNVEGWHDAVYRNHPDGPQFEDLGLQIAQRHLSQYVDGD